MQLYYAKSGTARNILVTELNRQEFLEKYATESSRLFEWVSCDPEGPWESVAEVYSEVEDGRFDKRFPTKQVEPKQVEPKQVEPKQVEPKKVEPKKVEPKPRRSKGKPKGESMTGAKRTYVYVKYRNRDGTTVKIVSVDVLCRRFRSGRYDSFVSVSKKSGGPWHRISDVIHQIEGGKFKAETPDEKILYIRQKSGERTQVKKVRASLILNRHPNGDIDSLGLVSTSRFGPWDKISTAVIRKIKNGTYEKSGLNFLECIYLTPLALLFYGVPLALFGYFCFIVASAVFYPNKISSDSAKIDPDQAADDFMAVVTSTPSGRAAVERIGNKDNELTRFQNDYGISDAVAEAAIKQWVLSHGGDFDWDLEDVKRICLRIR